jgi:hypothetical protein
MDYFGGAAPTPGFGDFRAASNPPANSITPTDLGRDAIAVTDATFPDYRIAAGAQSRSVRRMLTEGTCSCG